MTDISANPKPDEKSPEFYKEFYEKHRITVLVHDNLRKHFKTVIDEVLGDDYYNMGHDVYQCDELCCEDIIYKAKGFWGRLFKIKAKYFK